MSQELAPLEVSGIPQLEAAAEEVRATQQARRVTRGADALALLVPIPVPRGRKRKTARRGTRDALLQLAQLSEAVEVDPNQPTDVSGNKDKYLTDIYAGAAVNDDRL